jgi:hypothetical protein
MWRRCFSVRALVILMMLVVIAAHPAEGEQQDLETAKQPEIEDLGNNQYRIGMIAVDKKKNHFTLPGHVLRDSETIEFLAVARGGFKAYESVLELDATAHEFNTACLLIGLNPDKSRAPGEHFDPRPVEGDEVRIRVSWESDGETTRVDAADLVQQGEATLPRHNWVYTGSVVTQEGAFLAHVDGTLVGFVHSPTSVIEHKSGLGLGDYGSVVPNQSLLPPVGTPITMTIERPGT